MALSDLMVKIGADASGFVLGMRKAKGELTTTSKSIEEAENKFFSLQTQLKKADFGSDKWRKLKTDIAAARKEMESMRKQSGMMNQKGGVGNEFLSGLKGGIVGGGVAGVGMALASGVTAGISSALTLITDFDDSIRKVAATSRASAGDMAKLRDAAIDMGAKTRFTSSQAAEALNYMALAGWDAGKSIAALPGVLNLAAAAGTDLGMTADIVTDTMSTFMLASEKATDVADIFAAAQSRTNTTVEMLGEAMKYAAPQMASANQTLEDTAAVLGLLANQGIKGSMAGTAMNSTLNDLKKSAVDGKLAFGNMNIALYDQEGRFRNIFDIVREMKEAVKGLSTEQRDAITGGIFEERSIKAINILLNTTQGQIDDIASAMNNASGAGMRMADVMEGGVGGSMRRAESAWEAFKLSLGDGQSTKTWYDIKAAAADSMRDMKESIDGTSDGFSAFAKLVIAAGSPQGWGEVLVRTFDKVINKQKEFAQSTRDLSQPLKEAGLLGFAKPKKQTMPIGVLAPAKEFEAGDPDEKKKTAERVKNIKTAADAYKEVQAELLKTREYLAFVGQETDYVGEATQILQRQMETIFKMGGDEAVKYAALLRSEMQSLVDESRKADNTEPVTLLPTLSMGGVASEEIQLSGIIADQDLENLNAYNDALDRHEQALYDIATVSQIMGDAAFNGFASMASGALTAGQAMQQFGSQAAAGVMEFVRAKIMEAIATQAAEGSKFGVFGVPLIATAIGAIFGIMQGAMGKTKGIALADGGVAFGPTLATVGDNPGASYNPEVIAPLDKLTSIMRNTMSSAGGGGMGEVRFEIAGDKLYGVLKNVERKMSKFQ